MEAAAGCKTVDVKTAACSMLGGVLAGAGRSVCPAGASTARGLALKRLPAHCATRRPQVGAGRAACCRAAVTCPGLVLAAGAQVLRLMSPVVSASSVHLRLWFGSRKPGFASICDGLVSLSGATAFRSRRSPRMRHRKLHEQLKLCPCNVPVKQKRRYAAHVDTRARNLKQLPSALGRGHCRSQHNGMFILGNTKGSVFAARLAGEALLSRSGCELVCQQPHDFPAKAQGASSEALCYEACLAPDNRATHLIEHGTGRSIVRG